MKVLLNHRIISIYVQKYSVNSSQKQLLFTCVQFALHFPVLPVFFFTRKVSFHNKTNVNCVFSKTTLEKLDTANRTTLDKTIRTIRNNFRMCQSTNLQLNRTETRIVVDKNSLTICVCARSLLVSSVSRFHSPSCFFFSYLLPHRLPMGEKNLQMIDRLTATNRRR